MPLLAAGEITVAQAPRLLGTIGTPRDAALPHGGLRPTRAVVWLHRFQKNALA